MPAAESRLRQSLRQDLKRIAQRGRGLALQYGYRLKGCWYGPRIWPTPADPRLARPTADPPASRRQRLEPTPGQEQTAQIEAQSTQPRPKGLGKLTEQLITRELCDPKRFQNRRQVSSYLGLCPGRTQFRRSANNAAASPRPAIPGCAGRCAKRRGAWCASSPTTASARKWRAQILNPKTSAGRRKQLIVALARGFGVDWWRLCTGQTTAEKLGLVMAD